MVHPTSFLLGPTVAWLLSSTVSPTPIIGDAELDLLVTAVRHEYPIRRSEDAGNGVDPDSRRTRSQSIGLPHRGRLRHGVLLESGPHLGFKRGTRERQRWATDELVRLVEGAAAHVATVFPGARLMVGDLSRRSGGRTGRHQSHRSGRDADIVFYALDRDGKTVELEHMVRFGWRGHGRTPDGRRVVFDDERNWALVAYLLTNDIVEVDRIFVSWPLRARLLREAERQNAAPDLIRRAERLVGGAGRSHRDHFHVRIRCPENDRPRCKESP